MIYQLTVPGPIEDAPEIRLLEWHGGPGQGFASGELVVELETHKALFEIRATQPGVLRLLQCNAGEWRAAGAPLALFSDTADEPLPADLSGLPPWPAGFALS